MTAAPDPTELPPPRGRDDRRRPTLLVAHPSADLYGSDRVMLDTVEALIRRGWQVVVTMPDRGPLVELLEGVGARVAITPSPVLRKSALRPVGMLQLVATTVRSLLPGWRLIRSNRPDAVYVSTVTVPLWFVLARLARRPALCHVHEAESSVPKAVQRAMATPLLLSSGIVANSAFSLGVLCDALPRLQGRSRVLSNPVAGPPEPIDPREVLDAPTRVLYVGRLSPRKGPQFAVEAIAELTADGVDVHLDLLGSVFPGYEWFERDIRDEIAESGLEGRVSLLGFRRDVWPTIGTTDLVVVPSLFDEPFGNTAVEAVLAARPVIVSGSGGLLEAVDGYASAQTVPPGDASAIAAAIRRVVEDWPAFREAACADALVAARRHSIDRYGERVEAVLLGIIEAGRGGGRS